MQNIVKTALFVFALQASSVSAHEFWVEPVNSKSANMRVGQMMVGENLPYLDRIVLSARHFGPDGEEALGGREGDLPALAVDLSAPGLHVITLETKPAYIVFDTLAEFGDYLGYEGLQNVLTRHEARALPSTEIAEEYWRYARALVQSGPALAGDTDAPVGLRYELVAVTSPFSSTDGQVELKLTWEGAAEAGAQIAVFHKGPGADGAVSRALLQSDENGKVTAKVNEPGVYVFNAVHMLDGTGPGSVVWQSHWASLSFEIGRDGHVDQ